jgi:hypothetical protein
VGGRDYPALSVQPRPRPCDLLPLLPPFINDRQPRADTSTPNFRAALRMRRQAASRSASLTPSTWSNRAMALRTCRASFKGSFRSLGKANEPAGTLDLRLIVAIVRLLFT